MKKLIIIITIAIITFFNLPQRKLANALDNYAMVINENACFWSDASQKYVKFYLPYSYFVKVIEIGAEYSRVLYMDNSKNYPQSEGYVKTSDLDFSVSPKNNPYPNLTLICEISDVLFSDPQKQIPLTVINQQTSATYYGEITIDGDSYLFVYANGYAGYVRKSSFSAFTILPHESLNDLIKETPSSSQNDTSQNDNFSATGKLDQSTLKTIIIAVVIIIVLCFIYLILRPDKALSKEHSFFKDFDD